MAMKVLAGCCCEQVDCELFHDDMAGVSGSYTTGQLITGTVSPLRTTAGTVTASLGFLSMPAGSRVQSESPRIHAGVTYDPPADFKIEAWIKFPAIGGDARIYFTEDDYVGVATKVISGTNRFVIYSNIDANQTNVGAFTLTETTLLVEVCISFGTTFRVYVNIPLLSRAMERQVQTTKSVEVSVRSLVDVSLDALRVTDTTTSSGCPGCGVPVADGLCDKCSDNPMPGSILAKVPQHVDNATLPPLGTPSWFSIAYCERASFPRPHPGTCSTLGGFYRLFSVCAHIGGADRPYTCREIEFNPALEFEGAGLPIVGCQYLVDLPPFCSSLPDVTATFGFPHIQYFSVAIGTPLPAGPSGQELQWSASLISFNSWTPISDVLKLYYSSLYPAFFQGTGWQPFTPPGPYLPPLQLCSGLHGIADLLPVSWWPAHPAPFDNTLDSWINIPCTPTEQVEVFI